MQYKRMTLCDNSILALATQKIKASEARRKANTAVQEAEKQEGKFKSLWKDIVTNDFQVSHIDELVEINGVLHKVYLPCGTSSSYFDVKKASVIKLKEKADG